MIFVNSMCDLFHKQIPGDFIGRVCDAMERATWHTFQVLTKRCSLMRDFLKRRYGTGSGPAHIWFGVSVEDAAGHPESAICASRPPVSASSPSSR